MISAAAPASPAANALAPNAQAPRCTSAIFPVASTPAHESSCGAAGSSLAGQPSMMAGCTTPAVTPSSGVFVEYVMATGVRSTPGTSTLRSATSKVSASKYCRSVSRPPLRSTRSTYRADSS